MSRAPPGATSIGWHGVPSRVHSPCTRSAVASSLRIDTATWSPSVTLMSGAGTLNAAPSIPNASIRRAGPSNPSGRHVPAAARSRIVIVPPSNAPAARVLSFATTVSASPGTAVSAIAGLATSRAPVSPHTVSRSHPLTSAPCSLVHRLGQRGRRQQRRRSSLHPDRVGRASALQAAVDALDGTAAGARDPESGVRDG